MVLRPRARLPHASQLRSGECSLRDNWAGNRNADSEPNPRGQHMRSEAHVGRNQPCPFRCGGMFTDRSAVAQHLEADACASGVTRAMIDEFLRTHDRDRFMHLGSDRRLGSADAVHRDREIVPPQPWRVRLRLVPGRIHDIARLERPPRFAPSCLRRRKRRERREAVQVSELGMRQRVCDAERGRAARRVWSVRRFASARHVSRARRRAR